jgi:hypothetical protein
LNKNYKLGVSVKTVCEVAANALVIGDSTSRPDGKPADVTRSDSRPTDFKE